jgi:hypothetical protein
MENLKHSVSNYLSLKKLIVLYITTCGLYFFYWFYITNKKLYQHRHTDNHPFWRTAGLLVPFLNIYLLWKLFSDINKFTTQAGTPPLAYPGWHTIAFIVLSALYRIPHYLFSFLGFFSVLPILSAQRALNGYWQKEQMGLPAPRWSWIEVIISVIGSIMLVLAIMGLGLHPVVKESAPIKTQTVDSPAH